MCGWLTDFLTVPLIAQTLAIGTFGVFSHPIPSLFWSFTVFSCRSLLSYCLLGRQSASQNYRLYIKGVYQQHILFLMDLGKVVSSATFISVTADIESLYAWFPIHVVWHTTSSFIKTLWRDILLALKIFVNVSVAPSWTRNHIPHSSRVALTCFKNDLVGSLWFCINFLK